MENKIKTIDIQAREWFDKTFGNSYFSGKITVNANTETEKVFDMPFQNGYGNHYQTEAIEVLLEAGLFEREATKTHLRFYCEENGIKLSCEKLENQKKRDLILAAV